MSMHLAILRDIFPGQVYLTPKQIARALHGPGMDTKKRTEQVRIQLDSGSLIPGLCKDKGQKRLRVSIVVLALALDGELARRPKLVWPDVQPGRRSRFKNPGPRLAW